MKRGLISLIAAAAVAASAAGFAIGQVPWTTVSKDDLQICVPVYTETHRLELDFIRRQVDEYCALTSPSYSADSCKNQRDWLAESAARDALDWYYAGNEHCEGSDYTCFGPALYNDPRTGDDAREWTAQFIADATQSVRITPDMDFNAAARVADTCTAQVWVKKYRAMGSGAPVRNPTVTSSPAPEAPLAHTNADVTACLDAGPSSEKQLGKCDAVLAGMQPKDPDYGALAITLMQAYADSGRRADALRYGDMLAASKTGIDALTTQCVVRAIVKWDLQTGLQACTDAGPNHASALEARGQIHLLAGKWQDAWSDFDAAYKLDGAGQALYLRGLAAAAQGRMGDGLKDMADGEAKAPGTAQSYERDGYSLAAVSGGKPLAPPEAFAVAFKSPEPSPGPAPQAEPPQPPAAPAAEPVAPAAPTSMPRFDPDAPTGTPRPLGAAQIQACEDDVRALQEDSLVWQGSSDETAVKLGMMQRTIYAGRCAGHPMALNLIASAERMITEAGPRAAAATTTAEQTTPVVTDCLEPIPVGDARNLTASSVFRNTCDYPVTVSYCNITPVKGSWAASFACESKTSIALMTIAAKASAPAVFGRQINHFACRKPAVPVATYTPGGGLQGYCK
jgi:hypothetical protein